MVLFMHFVTSNLFAAQEINIIQSCSFIQVDNLNGQASPSGRFDLYLNNKYWSTLDQKLKQRVSSQLSEARSRAENFIRSQDSIIHPTLLNESSEFSALKAQIFDVRLARNLRLQAVRETSSSLFEKQLTLSFIKSFPLDVSQKSNG